MVSKLEICNRLKGKFPNLSPDDFDLTSPVDFRYNCIAWAANDNTRWWWPDPNAYWPINRADVSVENFEEAFSTLGYARLETQRSPEEVERIVLYLSGGVPTHAARQLVSGLWAAKLGPQWDVEHSRNAFCNGEYGDATVMFERVRHMQ